MVIRESAEMYLETILILSKNGPVKSVEVARSLNFSRPSVSVTLHNLEKENYVSFQEDGSINLEAKGKEIAERIYERHQVLSSLLEALGVTPAVAQEDACKFEHDISNETFLCLKKHLNENLKK